MKRMRATLAAGFTLIEMIIVIVIIGIAATAVTTMVANVGNRQSDNIDLQVGAQLLQECGEYIVAQHRRDQAFFSLTLSSSSTCYGITSFGGFGQPNVVVTDHTGGTGCPTAPGTPECKLVTITVTKSGTSLNPVNMILVKYN